MTLAACTTWQPVRPYPSFIHAAIKPGDKVKVKTTESEKSVFVVTEISASALVGDEQQNMFETCKIDPACRLLATQYHVAVRREGNVYFRTDASTYCEYDGPASSNNKSSTN